MAKKESVTHIPTIAELSQLTTHELSELFANVVLLLRRLPNVPLSDLELIGAEPDQQQQQQQSTLAEKVRREPKTTKGAKAVSAAAVREGGLPDWIE